MSQPSGSPADEHKSPSVKFDDNDPDPNFFRITFIVDNIRVENKVTCCMARAVIANGSVSCDIQTRLVHCDAKVKKEAGGLVHYTAKYKLPLDIVPGESHYKTKNGVVLVYLKKAEVQSWVPYISQIKEESAQ